MEKERTLHQSLAELSVKESRIAARSVLQASKIAQQVMKDTVKSVRDPSPGSTQGKEKPTLAKAVL